MNAETTVLLGKVIGALVLLFQLWMAWDAVRGEEDFRDGITLALLIVLIPVYPAIWYYLARRAPRLREERLKSRPTPLTDRFGKSPP